MIFMYWTGSMLSEPPAAAAWRERFPETFRVFSDDDVLPLIGTDVQRDCFRRINIPACKSDVARLVLLREYGGIYVDGHTGPGSGDRIAETLMHLSKYELIFFREGWKEDFGFYGNTFMAAQRRPLTLELLVEKAFENLLQHMKAEDSASEYVSYNIFYLTGSPIIIDCLFDQNDPLAWKNGWDVKAEFRKVVLTRVKQTETSDIGFVPWSFYHYRHWGQHWTERQKNERLFTR
jgi:mannosyltransferase OCH1-like enzyme